MGTNWAAINTFEDMLVEANKYSPFWLAILMMLWVTLVITFLPMGTSVALLGGSFLALVMGIFLVYMGLVGWKWLLMIVGVIIFTIIWDALNSKKEQ
jgi:uncharacterized membrane protein